MPLKFWGDLLKKDGVVKIKLINLPWLESVGFWVRIKVRRIFWRRTLKNFSRNSYYRPRRVVFGA